jgi:pilus assembly protein CpaB
VRIDRRFAVVLGVSLVWALFVTAFFVRVTRGKDARPAVAEKPLVVAVRALPLGSVVAADAVRLRGIPESMFPAGGFSRLEDVIDRPVTSNIQADEPVLEARIAARGSGIGLAPLIPPGMRAISVRVNDVVGVAGFVLPGMRVDVLVTGQASNHPETMTRTVLQNIGVLSAGQTIQNDGKNAISTPVVTLLVTPEDAEALTLANIEGRIQLVLRNSSDLVLANPRGRQLNELYGPRIALPPAASTAAPAAAPRRERQAAPAAAAPKVDRPAAALPAATDQVTMIRGAVKTVETAGKAEAK